MGKMPNSAPVWKAKEVAVYNLADAPFTSEKPDAESKIQFALDGVAAAAAENGGCPYTTFPALLKQAAKTKPNLPALRVEASGTTDMIKGRAPPSAAHNTWKTWTFSQFYNDTARVAKACIKYGYQRFDTVAIFGFNSPEWIIAHIGSMMAGGKAMGVYSSDTAEILSFKVMHANASVAFCEGASELDKFKEIVDEVPYLKVIVTWAFDAGVETLERKDGSKIYVLTFEQFLAKGDAENAAELDARMALIKPTHCACLIYTSGTTGNPKAVMLTHDNVIFAATVVTRHLPFIGAKPEQERILSYLPLSHAAGTLLDIVTSIVVSATKPGYFTVYFARPYDLKKGTLKDRLQCVRPTMFLGVPRVWEKIQEKIKSLGAKASPTKKKIAAWAKSKGLAYQSNLQIGRSGAKPHLYALADKLVLSKVKDNLGLDQCKFAFSGAAPLTKDTLEYFGALGININECYGMSECVGSTTCSRDDIKQFGTVGFAAPSTEVKAFKVDPEDINKKVECPRAKNIFSATDAEQGELCYRGRHIMLGYMANPLLGPEHVTEIQKKNADAIDAEGWLHSGDMGTISRQNMVKITGRYKELIIGAGGENIAPVPIEDEIKMQCGAVSNVMMIGDKRKFNVCLITLKVVGASGELPGGDELDGEAASLVSGITSVTEAMNSPAYTKMIEDAIKRTNKNGKVCPSNAATIQKFMILPRDVSVSTGELTATLKLKRGVVMKKFEEAIESIYASKETYVKYGGPVPMPQL